MDVKTSAGPFCVARSTKATGGDTAAETTTEPTGVGVHNLTTGNGGLSANCMRVIVAGEGADDSTGAIFVTLWNSFVGTSGIKRWVPTRLCEIDFTLSSATGVDTTLGFDRYADTLALVMPASSVPGVTIHSNADNTQAFFSVDLMGAEKVQISFTFATATAGNALLAFY